jgi:ribosomal protein RSM22 (predicted rRNA methylase)
MRNFYEINPQKLIHIHKFMDEWKKKCELHTGDIKTKCQSLGSHSKTLWSFFNEERNEDKQTLKNKHYMETPQGLQAYIASFLLPNIERVFSLLVRDENSVTLKNICKKSQSELTIADFGSGPLSATIGLFCALEYLASQDENLIIPEAIKIYAIERSEKIFMQGKELLENSIFPNNKIHIERITSVEKLPEQIDVSLCVNVFNEIPSKHRIGNLKKIAEKLTHNGILFILEPAQEQHSKELGHLRDTFLQTEDLNFQIISPCTHKKPCPLANSTTRKDWCWFRHGWNPPYLLKEIDKFSKIDHHFLNFSYLLMTKNSLPVHEMIYARSVSEKLNIDLNHKNTLEFFKHNMVQGDENNFLMKAQHEIFSKMLLCTQDGSLNSILIEEENTSFEYKKGMRIQKKDSLEFLFKERN